MDVLDPSRRSRHLATSGPRLHRRPDDWTTAYRRLNVSTAPLWLAMILAPRAAGTARALRAATPLLAALGAVYLGFLAGARGGGRVDVTDADSVRRALTSPEGFLAAWTHLLAFDLFVGRWIWETGLAEGRSTRVALLLTWFAGPAGLLLFLAQRRTWRAG